jgi:lysophospholipase L1-like esterase
MSLFYNPNTYNWQVAQQLPANAARLAAIDLAGNNASFKNFFTGNYKDKVIQTFGNSTANSGAFSRTFIDDITKPGDLLEGFDVTTKSAEDNYNSIGKLRIRGSNGNTLERMLRENHLERMIDLDDPALMINMLLINDIRVGTSVRRCREMVRECLQRTFAKKPDMCVVLCIENSLGCDEKLPNGKWRFEDQLILTPQTTTVIGQVAVPPGETRLTWGPAGRPSSIDRVGQEIIIAKGTANEETVTLRYLSDEYFIVVLTKTQYANSTVEATLYGASQAYSTALREAILPFVNCDPRVAVLDFQSLIFGLEPPYYIGGGEPNTVELLNDPLHPSYSGEPAKARAVAELLRKMYYKNL